MQPEPTPRKFADEGEVITTFKEIRSTLARIEEQTVRTNGRVQSLEQFRFAAKAVIAVLMIQAGWAIAFILNARGG